MSALMAPVLLAAAQGEPAGADFSNDTWWIVLIKAVGIVLFLLLSVLIAIWFERKVVARMQIRPGPNVHGPFGLLQSTADAVKLLLKEEMTVRGADKVIYVLAPMISVFASLLVFAVIPMGPEVNMFGVLTPLQLTDFPVAVLYVLAVASVGVYGMVLGGWASGSTYPLLGSVRSTAQVISYELAMGMSLVSVFIVAGTMSTSQIVEAQTRVWYAFALAPAFLLYLIAMTGETNRLPFDLPEAEGELVGGYSTEYSSMKFAWFFLAEYINMINVSAVATTLFLGGWHAPWPISLINDGMFDTGYWPVLWFLAKLWLLMFFFVWLRGTLLRLRYDQFMKFGWKVLIPTALVWIVAVAAVQSVRQFSAITQQQLLFTLAGVAVVALIVMWLVPETKPKPDSRPSDDEPFDAFAGGYPVPPLPGQTLPPSPRRAAAMVEGAASTVVVDTEATADDDTEDSNDDVTDEATGQEDSRG